MKGGCNNKLGVVLDCFSKKPYLGIARHCFAQSEIDVMVGLPHTLQRLIFFNIWTQKEAYIKACGIGLTYPTNSFQVPFIPGTNVIIEDSFTKEKWQIISFMPQPNCCAALCTHYLIKTINFIHLKSLMLLQRGDYFAN